MAELSRAVFLSYASQDTEAARRICEALRAAGVEVWFDQSELRGGDAWDQRIRREIRDCALFIPIISSNTTSRPEGYFRLEWAVAEQRAQMIARNKAFIVPVCVDGTPESAADVPESFVRVQWTRLPEGATPPAFAGRIRHLLQPELAASPPLSASAAVPHSAAVLHPAPNKTRTVMLLAAAAVLIAAGVFALDRFVLSKRTQTEAGAAPAVTPAAQPSTPSANAIPDKSIAVLPFADMSEKKDQEYFSDGLSEELIDLLAKNPDLYVPARTSSFYFKGKSEELATIAQKLHVANVLEGSVRRSGNRLRVTAQLIRVDNGYHLWSETYDRDSNDIFKVQDDISSAVVAALKVKLLSTPEAAGRQTTNADAHSQYLIGRELMSRGNWNVARNAADAFRRAINLDPNYVAAWAWLSRALHDAAEDYPPAEQAAERREALAAAEKAVALGPQVADGYAARGYLRTWNLRDFAGADADYQRARALAPEDTDVQRGYINSVLYPTGRSEEGLALAQQVLKADPLNSSAWRVVGAMQYEHGDFTAARESLQRSLDINPDQSNTAAFIVYSYIVEGKPALALPWVDRPTAEVFREQTAALVQHDLGHQPEAQRNLDALIARWANNGAYQIGEVYAWWGDKDAAFHWLERAEQQRDGGMTLLKVDLFLKSLHGDPRYSALLRKMNLAQ
jgi:TolB-like protein/cytochrome c-type biogenesis protein CcmH/NrfG